MAIMKFYFLIFLVLNLALCVENPNSTQEIEELVKTIKMSARNISEGNIRHRSQIIISFRDLYKKDISRFFQEIWSSPHQFTIPIAMIAVSSKGPPAYSLAVENVVHCLKGHKKHFLLFYHSIIGTIDRMNELFENLVFDSVIEISFETKKVAVKNLSACLLRLFKIYKAEASSEKRYNNGTKTYYEFDKSLDDDKINATLDRWNEIFWVYSRYLFQADPRDSLLQLLPELIKDFQATPDYSVILTKSIILRNLAKKVLSLERFKYLHFLASKPPIFNCLFWFFGLFAQEAENQYGNYILTNAASIAKRIISDKRFRQLCCITILPSGGVFYDGTNGLLGKTIYHQLINLLPS
jgi:hypothetical protein